MRLSGPVWTAIIIAIALVVTLIALYIIVPELGPVTPNGATPGQVE